MGESRNGSGWSQRLLWQYSVDHGPTLTFLLAFVVTFPQHSTHLFFLSTNISESVEGVPYSPQPVINWTRCFCCFFGICPLELFLVRVVEENWGEIRRTAWLLKSKKNLIVWEGVEKPARFQMGGGSKSLGKGGGRPCADRSSWVLGRIRDPSVMATKECLCIQGPLGWWTAMALGTGWVALGSGCCSPGEWKVFMPTIWMGACAKDSLCPRETQRPQLWMGRVCFPSHLFHLSVIPTCVLSLDIFSNYGLPFSWSFISRFSLTKWTWTNLVNKSKHTDQLIRWLVAILSLLSRI